MKSCKHTPIYGTFFKDLVIFIPEGTLSKPQLVPRIHTGIENFLKIKIHNFWHDPVEFALFLRKHFPLSSVFMTDLLNSAFPWDACMRMWLCECECNFRLKVVCCWGTLAWYGRGEEEGPFSQSYLSFPWNFRECQNWSGGALVHRVT